MLVAPPFCRKNPFRISRKRPFPPTVPCGCRFLREIKSGEKILLILTGMASYYAEDFNGKQTSDGEVYDMNSLTAAHRTFTPEVERVGDRLEGDRRDGDTDQTLELTMRAALAR